MLRTIGIVTVAAMSGPLMLGFSALINMVMAWPLKWAWNYAMPGLFGLPILTYWQSFCLLIVSHMLVKNNHTIKYGGE